MINLPNQTRLVLDILYHNSDLQSSLPVEDEHKYQWLAVDDLSKYEGYPTMKVEGAQWIGVAL